MNIKKELHSRIKELRIQNNLTQQQVADFIEVDVSTYAHYEKGDRTPAASKLAKLAELYKLEDEMLGAQFPIESFVSYAPEEIDFFKEALNKCKWIEGNDIHNRYQYEYLSEAARPIFDSRSAALSLPDINLSNLNNGQTVAKVKLDMVGEALISKYFNEIENYYKMGSYRTMVSKRKIEARSISALREIVDAHPTMDSHINDNDKEASWDGYLRLLFDGDTESEKKNFDADIPIQVKGHIDINNEFFKKSRITYPVAIDDLNVYFRSKGCLYFQIFMAEDGKKSVIFYNSLYPSKIKSYLDQSVAKGNRKNVSIPFTVLKKDPYALELLCKQFDRETVCQGSGRGQIMERIIHADDLARVKDMEFTVIGARNPYEALQRITSGDVAVYGKFEQNGIAFPVGWGDKFNVALKQRVQGKISIGKTVYYDSFLLEFYATAPSEKDYSKDVRKRVYVSPNLYLEFFSRRSNFTFELNTDIMQISNDAEFLMAFIENNNIFIDGKQLLYDDIDISDDFQKRISGLAEVGKALHDIGCNITIPFKDLTENDKKQLDFLVNIKKGNMMFNTTEPLFFYDWQFRDKIFPFLVEKRKRVQLKEYMFSRTLKISFGSPEEDNGMKVNSLPDDAYLVPNYSLLTAEQLASLYYIDYESMFDQIDRSVINDKTRAVLDGLSLKLIAAYDLCGDDRLLEVSRSLLERLIAVYTDAVNLKINMLQIEKRQNGQLSEESREMLSSMRHQVKENSGSREEAKICRVLGFCSAVLVDEAEIAKETYAELDQDEKGMVDGMPIMKLYDLLEKS